MSTFRRLLAGSIVAVAMTVASAQLAQGQPLTPLTPAELQYLEHVRTVLTASNNKVAFRSDGELLAAGRSVCELRSSHGLVGEKATFQPSAVTQLAFIYLCPS